MKERKDLLGLIDTKVQGEYLPWWAYEASLKCKYQYFLIKERPKGVYVARKVTIELLRGCGLHAGMEHWISGVSNEECKKIIADEIIKVNENQLAFNIVSLVIDEAIQYFEVAKSMVAPFRVGKGYSEVTVRQGYKGYVLACRVDHVEVLDLKDKICDIWDYKCSTSKNSVKSMQLRFNACCLFLAGWTVRKAAFIMPRVPLVKPIKWSEKLKIRLLRDIIEDMPKVKSSTFPPSPSIWNCTFCNWARSCRHSVLQIDLGDLKEGKVDW